MSKQTIFSTVHIEGSLLSNEFLQCLINGDQTLEGIKPEDYYLSPTERLNEAATRSYLRLTGVWESFKNHIKDLADDDIGTTETRERWLYPLFHELGYNALQTQKSIEIEGKFYPISHKSSEPVAIHLISYKWDLDRINPSARGSARRSPHSLMQEFLNRSSEHLWGFLANGYKLRLLRDNVSLTRSSYIEFDLQAMMDGEVYSDFFLLWMLCHQSRLKVDLDDFGKPLPPESCFLEKWYNFSQSEGIRIWDELRDKVKLAIEAFGCGFLSHPSNSILKENLSSGKLTKSEFYHQILHLVYRIIFILVAEERNLLLPPDLPDNLKKIYYQYYSLQRIKKIAKRKRGTKHSDLYKQMRITFTGLYSGNEILGLPALGSFLFKEESTSALNNCEIANSDLLTALRFLCYTQKNNVYQEISYRNLGSEELGSIYESFLEMHPDLNIEAGTFVLKVISGSERKTTGSYYTPDSLVNCLLDTALEPVINSALKKANTEDNSPENQEKALLNLKICDPACGSGHFLLKAAHRLAKRLASLRAQEEEPSPLVIQNALRDVISHCIYGVDLNPLAVELCKISLWMDALEPGKPLTFLDHHIKCGNSLLGCTPQLLKEGIPDSAFTPLTGDDKSYCSYYKKRNKEERSGVQDIFTPDNKNWSYEQNIAPSQRNLNQMPEENLADLQKKEQAYQELQASESYLNSKFIYDAWCAAFVIKKTEQESYPYLITQGILYKISENPYYIDPKLRKEIIRLADVYQFFHWHLAFPEVFSADIANDDNAEQTNQLPIKKTPGFDCVLGNPPWEKVKLQEKEFFAARDTDIANAPNASKRKELIAALPNTNPDLYQEFRKQLRIAEASSLLIREGGNFPLCGIGDLNTYTVFAELNRNLLNNIGYCGCIVPSGIATDDTTKMFFSSLIITGSLHSLYDFENRKGIFPGIHRSFKFCLLTIAPLNLEYILNKKNSTEPAIADFVFFATSIADLKDPERHFKLSQDDIELLNPNTLTCPIFRNKSDAELTKYIYRRVPILINENYGEEGNPWGISFLRMFDMSNDSYLFKTKIELEAEGFELSGNHFTKGEEHFLPLYEAKMIHHFNYRFGDYTYLPEGSVSTQLPKVPLNRLQDPHYEPLPRYWVNIKEILQKLLNPGILFGFRDITNVTNERTFISSAFPLSAVGNTLPLISSSKYDLLPLLLCNMNSFCCDYLIRQKVGGTHMTYNYVKQFPVLTDNQYSAQLFQFIISRFIELSFTSYGMTNNDVTIYNGPPFIWDEERRFEILCELDALYFHLYLGTQKEWEKSYNSSSQESSESASGNTINPLLAYFKTPRKAVEYIMETFPIVKRKDEEEFGEYRTKLRILAIYDQMTPLFEDSSDRIETSTYISALNPPPGPPCDENGNFIPPEKWDINSWPSHIHQQIIMDKVIAPESCQPR
ncbi:MAG TPA: N-6 DNA methylase [Candidatus Cloacimonas sp.]|nr:N-6 DNA methylase [Candidatus Cloacimonas sp.]